MPLIGDQQDDDRAQIAEVVVSRMSQTMPRTASPSPVRGAAGQPTQVLTHTPGWLTLTPLTHTITHPQ